MPTILARRVVFQSKWLDLVEKDVVSGRSAQAEPFYCVTQAPYVGIVALTDDGRVPIVRQFRPCVETETWELPAGTLDPGETAAEAGRRELLEETGLDARTLEVLGCYFPDTGRLQLPSYVVFARVGRPSAGFLPEAGMQLRFVTPRELDRMVLGGEFAHQLHLAALHVASLRRLLPVSGGE